MPANRPTSSQGEENLANAIRRRKTIPSLKRNPAKETKTHGSADSERRSRRATPFTIVVGVVSCLLTVALMVTLGMAVFSSLFSKEKRPDGMTIADTQQELLPLPGNVNNVVKTGQGNTPDQKPRETSSKPVALPARFPKALNEPKQFEAVSTSKPTNQAEISQLETDRRSRKQPNQISTTEESNEGGNRSKASPLPSLPIAEMPEDYSDYALNPETGDIMALSDTFGQAVLFRRTELDAGKVAPAAKVRVGTTPCCVFFKRYRETKVFAVVCSQDANMYLVDAVEGKLIKMVELSQSGVSSVTGSINPEDPFLYYNYGSGHESCAGTVNLRTMRNHPVAIDGSMDCAISASGETAYRRGPWSPSGFEALRLTNRFEDDAPIFKSIFRKHESTDVYLPDPFDRYTAAGNRIFTRTLEKSEASFDFIPKCFFKKVPVIVGVQYASRVGRPDPETEVVLRAASYNTFSNVGIPVRLNIGNPADGGELPRGVPSQADFKRVAKRTRIIADDERSQVIYAGRQRITFIPLEKFQLPDEPFLLATLDAPQQLLLGQESKITVNPIDPRVEVQIDAAVLPTGATAEGKSLNWKPMADQIGPVSFLATLKHNNLQRTMLFPLQVVYPSVNLPFTPSRIEVKPDAKQLVIWNGHLAVPANAPRTARTESATSNESRLARIDLESGKVAVERTFSEPVRSVGFSGDQLIVLFHQNSPRVELLNASDLRRSKGIVCDAAVLSAGLVGKLLMVVTEVGVELYEPESFKRIRVYNRADQTGDQKNSMPNGVVGENLLINGVLYDQELKPRLILMPGIIPVLPGWDSNAHQKMQTSQPQVLYERPHERGGTKSLQTVTASLPDANVQVVVELRSHIVQESARDRAPKKKVELKIIASGDVEGEQLLFSEEFPHDVATLTASLQLTRSAAYVAFRQSLYRWPLPTGSSDNPALARLQFVPRQSTIELPAKGTTVLKHEVQGGKSPLKFSIATPLDGIRIDEKSGELTLDGAAIQSEAMRAIEQTVGKHNDGQSLLERFLARVDSFSARGTEILGRKPNGTPVAVPVRVEVQDADVNTDNLQYFVIAEVPNAEINKRLRKLDDDRIKSAPIRPQVIGDEVPAVQKKLAAKSNDEVGELRRRVDSLEQRLDLITRQLNKALEELDRRK